MISERKVGSFHEPLAFFQARRTPVYSPKTRIELRTEQEKELQEALPHGEVDQPCFAGLKALTFFYGLPHCDQFVNSPHVHPHPDRIKKCQMCPHFHHSKRSRERLSFVYVPLLHFIMWNIATLHYMPQQISWGTLQLTVVVNRMKASHKTAESPWYNRNIL